VQCKLIRVLPPLVLLMWLSGPAFAGLDLRNASVEQLDNGMTVILLVDRNFPVVSVQMLYRVGARDESYGQTGIAHFLEHMAFRDSRNFPDTDVVSSIYARGGEWHGYTWTDETTYFATVPKEHLDLLLRIEADRMTRLEISIDDMEAERGAVLAEMHSYENSPSSLLLDAVMATSFLAHPYRNNTIGWESDIDNMQHADVVRFYERHYQPANAVLAVVGDFDAAQAGSRIAELFGAFEGSTPTPLPVTVEPQQRGERRVRLYGSADDKRFVIAWRAPSVHSDDFPAFLVLQEVLGSSSGINFAQNDWGAPVGEGSILDGAAEDLTTWYPPSAQDYLFVIGGSVAKDVPEADAEDGIQRRLERIRQAPPAAKLVAESIGKVQDELVYDVATTEDAAHQLAFFGGLNALDRLLELPALVAAVDAGDVQRVAQAWLVPPRRTIGWYVPDESPDEEPARPAAADAGTPVTSAPPPRLDEVPVPPPAMRKLSGGIPVILQHSDLSSSVELQVIVHGNALRGGGIATDEPVRGYSSLSWRCRPDELRSVIGKARAALAQLEPAESAGDPSDDPETRLAEAFDDLMSTGPVRAPEVVTPAVIVVSGDVDEDDTLALLEEHFDDLRDASAKAPQAGAFEPDDIVIRIGHPIAQAQLGYIVPAPRPDDGQAYAYRLLLYILSHGYEGRLGKEAISNRGLAYYIDARYRSDGVNGWITLAVGVDPEKVVPLKSLLKAELERLRREPPTAAEIEEAKAYLLGRARSAAQSNEELASALAKDFLWYGVIRSSDELAERLSTITREEVAAIVPAFIDGSTMVVEQ
jgi:zinc protease